MTMRQPFDPERVKQNYTNGSWNVERRFKLYEFAQPYEDVDAEIVSSLDLNSHETIVDIGTSAGKFLFDLRTGPAQHKGALYGIEPFVKQLPSGEQAMWAAVNDIVFKEGWADSIPLQDNFADIMTAKHVYYHVPREKQAAAINESKRVLKPDGIFVLATSGPANKIRHRQLEKRMAESLGIQPPPYMNDGYDSDRAANELPAQFRYVYHHMQRSLMVLDTVSKLWALYDSLGSLYNQFDPPMSSLTEVAIETAEDLVYELVEREFTQLGSFTDLIMRDFFLCSDRQLTLPDPDSFTDISLPKILGNVAIGKP